MTESRPLMTQDPRIQETFDYMIGLAKERIGLDNSFVPFGAGARPSGERVHFNLDTEKQIGGGQEAIAMLVHGLRDDHSQRELEVAGLVFESQIRVEADVFDAIGVHIETRDGQSVQGFLPFLRGTPEGVSYYEPFFKPVDPQIFA